MTFTGGLKIQPKKKNENFKVIKGETCPSCNTDSQEIISLISCKHYQCHNCWEKYLKSILENENPKTANCHHSSCNEILEYYVFGKFLNHEDYMIYLKLQSNNLVVGDNQQIKWCPNKRCGIGHDLKLIEKVTIKCECGEILCGKCGRIDHFPLNCNDLKQWEGIIDPNNLQDLTNFAYLRKCVYCFQDNGEPDHRGVFDCAYCCRLFCWNCLRRVEDHTSLDDSMVCNEQNSMSEANKKLIAKKLKEQENLKEIMRVKLLCDSEYKLISAVEKLDDKKLRIFLKKIISIVINSHIAMYLRNQKSELMIDEFIESRNEFLVEIGIIPKSKESDTLNEIKTQLSKSELLFDLANNFFKYRKYLESKLKKV